MVSTIYIYIYMYAIYDNCLCNCGILAGSYSLSSASENVVRIFVCTFFFLSLFTSIHGYANSSALKYRTSNKNTHKAFYISSNVFSRFLIFPLALCIFILCIYIYRLLHSLRVLCILNRNLCNRLHCIKSCVSHEEKRYRRLWERKKENCRCRQQTKQNWMFGWFMPLRKHPECSTYVSLGMCINYVHTHASWCVFRTSIDFSSLFFLLLSFIRSLSNTCHSNFVVWTFSITYKKKEKSTFLLIFCI